MKILRLGEVEELSTRRESSREPEPASNLRPVETLGERLCVWSGNSSLVRLFYEQNRPVRTQSRASIFNLLPVQSPFSLPPPTCSLQKTSQAGMPAACLFCSGPSRKGLPICHPALEGQKTLCTSFPSFPYRSSLSTSMQCK